MVNTEQRTVKVAIYDFPGPFYGRFPRLSRTIYIHFLCVFPKLFNRVDIKHIRFFYTLVLCDTWNWSHDNDTIPGIEYSNPHVALPSLKNICLLCLTSFNMSPFFVAVTQCAVVVNDRAIQLQTARYWNWYRHYTWRYRGTAIYRVLFDTGIETLVLTIFIDFFYIKVSKISHNT